MSYLPEGTIRGSGPGSLVGFLREGRSSVGKHGLEGRDDLSLSLGINCSDLSYESGFINCAHFVQYDLSLSPLKFAENSCGIIPHGCRHRRDDDGSYMMVHLIR